MAPEDDFPKQAGYLLLRAFLGPFWMLQAYFKLRDPKTGQLTFEAWWGWSTRQVESFAASTPLGPWATRPYTLAVPAIEIAVGLAILLGWKSRWALVAASALLVSLSYGLMLQGEHDTVKSNTILLLTMLLALGWERFNRWSLDDYLAKPRRP